MTRMWLKIRNLLFRTGRARADYFRKKRLFGKIGNKVMIQTNHLPYDPHMVFLGDNVKIATGGYVPHT